MIFEIKVMIEADSFEDALKMVQPNIDERIEEDKEEINVKPVQEETPIAQGEIPAPVATVLPTAEAKGYSFEEIAKAMVQLRDSKGSDELMGVLTHFGVKALTEIPKDKYNELVTILNEKGVKI